MHSSYVNLFLNDKATQTCRRPILYRKSNNMPLNYSSSILITIHVPSFLFPIPYGTSEHGTFAVDPLALLIIRYDLYQPGSKLTIAFA